MTWVLSLIFLVLAVPAYAGCDQDTISRVSGSGSLIVMLSGAVYETSDTMDSMMWQPTDGVLVCETSDAQVFALHNMDEDDDDATYAIRIDR